MIHLRKEIKKKELKAKGLKRVTQLKNEKLAIFLLKDFLEEGIENVIMLRNNELAISTACKETIIIGIDGIEDANTEEGEFIISENVFSKKGQEILNNIAKYVLENKKNSLQLDFYIEEDYKTNSPIILIIYYQ